MYRPHLRLLLLGLLAAATLSTSGCLFRTRTLDRQLSQSPLKSDTQQDLIDYVNNQASKIQSMQATVDIDASANLGVIGDFAVFRISRGRINVNGRLHGLHLGRLIIDVVDEILLGVALQRALRSLAIQSSGSE